MVAHDQCPSSKKEGLPGKEALAETPRAIAALSGRTGRRYWRGIEELADTPDFREFVEREFPAGASEFMESSRRTFLQLMGASLALAGAAVIPGCRRPEHKIMPYSADVPEDIVAGKPLFYATSMPMPGGGAEGLIVETHEGRPTKIEGNPLHPLNQGKSSSWSQASVLGLYDPERLKSPFLHTPSAADPHHGEYKSWEDFAVWAREHFARFDASRGAGLAFLVAKGAGVSRDFMKQRVRQRWPDAKWIAYDAADSPSPVEGAKAAFGQPVRELFDLKQAKVILSLDRDVLNPCSGHEPAGLVNARDFAATRRVQTTRDGMSRLYVVESAYSITGAAADHRLALPPTRVAAFAVALARRILAQHTSADAALRSAVEAVEVPAGADPDEKFLGHVVEDLLAEDDGHGNKLTRKGQTLIVAGPSLPPAVHALVHALNAALGNAGQTVRYMPISEDEAADSATGLAGLTADLAGGRVRTVVTVNCNPVYDAPAGFAAEYAKATTICLGVENSETAGASTWELNGAHVLESWGDTLAADGTHAPMQPMIAPLYDGRSDLELLSIILGDEKADGHAIVREAWRARGGANGDFEKWWKRSLHDGVFAGARVEPVAADLTPAGVAGALGALRLAGAPSGQSLDVVFAPGHLYDGRMANYGWLQELPQPGSRVCWDNPALMSPATAEALGVVPEGFSRKDPGAVYTSPKYPEAAVATVTVDGRSLDMPVWILPGMADNTVALTLGYGRTVSGKVGMGVGFNTYALRAGRGPARGATVKPTGARYMIASTQMHWSIDGRTALVRSVDLGAWQKFGDETDASEDRLYKTPETLAFGERVAHGELTHTPPNINLYAHPYQQAPGRADPADTDTLSGRQIQPDAGAVYAQRPQWAMSIDLATCTGCGTCTIACQAENNIPIVGKKEVAKGREMTWIRVDRYFTGDPLQPEEMIHQPVPCMHCENAPCETVCPVNATVHGPEGINYMTYNRCIGTRYCANNCPYKVRRFNFFDYGVTKFKGTYYGEETAPYWGKRNPNLVPPRLRAKLDEITRMAQNPEVTVRSRGVMEKCSYCIQRINRARVETKLQGLANVPDGFFQTACQQACPSEAIVFGDALDPQSRVKPARDHARTYAMLGYLNARPRTTYMVGVKNPNRKLLEAQGRRERIELMDNPFGHGGGHGPGGGGDGHAEPTTHGAGDADVMNRSSFLRETGKAAADRGYALSLRVLGAVTGVHA